MLKQISIGNVLDENDIQISPGDYVEHQSKPGIPLLVVEGPTISVTNHVCYKVKDQKGKVFSVRMDYIKRI